jgi:hypothetical protein
MYSFGRVFWCFRATARRSTQARRSGQSPRAADELKMIASGACTTLASFEHGPVSSPSRWSSGFRDGRSPDISSHPNRHAATSSDFDWRLYGLYSFDEFRHLHSAALVTALHSTLHATNFRSADSDSEFPEKLLLPDGARIRPPRSLEDDHLLGGNPVASGWAIPASDRRMRLAPGRVHGIARSASGSPFIQMKLSFCLPIQFDIGVFYRADTQGSRE